MKGTELGSTAEYSGELELISIGEDKNSKSRSGVSVIHGGDMKTIFLCYFGLLGLGCLVILYGSLIGIVIGTNSGLQSSIEEDLNSQMKDQAYSTLNEAGDYLTRVLNGYDEVCALHFDDYVVISSSCFFILN